MHNDFYKHYLHNLLTPELFFNFSTPVYNNGYFKVAFFPSQEHDLSVFVLTYLLRHRQNGRMI
jgi:hypothetical protein